MISWKTVSRARYSVASLGIVVYTIASIVSAGPVFAAAPDTAITLGPRLISSDTTPQFEFQATEESTFECKIDGGLFVPCTSPFETAPLAVGLHAFEVQATNLAAEIDPTPATYEWEVRDIIVIDNCTELQLIGHDLAYPLDGLYELSGPIDCTATNVWNDNGNWFEGFDPIGDGDNPFTGVFDGLANTIEGLHIQRADDSYEVSAEDESYVGLFGAVEDGGMVHNVSLTSAMVKGYIHVGGIAGYLQNAEIQNVSVNNGVDEDNPCNPGYCVWARHGVYGGGIVGSAWDSTIHNANSFGPVKGSGATIGGIVGMLTDGSNLSASSSYGTIDGGINIGGIAGEVYNSIIDNTHAYGDVRVISDQEKVGNQGGGFIGYVDGGTITNSSASGDVYGSQQIGGFIGSAEDTSISDSIANGYVDGSEMVGGFIGIAGGISVQDATAFGDVESNNGYTGGFVGGSYCESSYDDVAAAGVVDSSGMYVGGFVGDDGCDEGLGSTYTDSHAAGKVSGYGLVGGFMGRGYISTLDRVYAVGDVSSTTWEAGGLVGEFSGTALNPAEMIESFATGDVITGGFSAGGLVGATGGEGTNLVNVYARGSATATQYAGGLVGYAGDGTQIVNAYATGEVTITDSEIEDPMAGGLVGDGQVDLQVTSSFWDTTLSGQSTSAGGTGKTRNELLNVDTYTLLSTEGLDAAWDFVDDPNDDNDDLDTWFISEGMNNGYPCLAWQGMGCSANNLDLPGAVEIDSCEELLALDDSVSLKTDVTLTANIDCGGAETASLFTIDEDNPYEGVFDGAGYKISNLTINNPEDENVGLIGAAANTALIDLTLQNVTVNGFEDTGVLVGDLYNSVVDNVHVNNGTVNVDEGGYAGVLVGYIDSGTSTEILNSSATGTLTSSGPNTGGLVGFAQAEDGELRFQKVFADVAITGSGSDNDWGGLIGELESGAYQADSNVQVTDAYAWGDVTTSEGNQNVGGLIGRLDSFVSDGEEVESLLTINAAYASGAVTGYDYVGGLFGTIDELSPNSSIYVQDSFTMSPVTALAETPEFTGGIVGGGPMVDYFAVSINNYWDVDRSGQESCDPLDNFDCIGVNEDGSDPNYFINNTENNPLASWDFDETWVARETTPPTFAVLAQQDSDADGISDEEEQNGPNGGDANNDTIDDDQQANVTSFSNNDSGSYTVIVTTCDNNFNVQSGGEAAGDSKDAGFDYPAGLQAFVGRDCGAPGVEVTVTLYYYGFTKDGFVLRKWDSNNSYSTIAGAVLTNETIGGQSVLKAVYTVTDGGDLDQDNAADGNIVDPVGIGKSAVGAPNTGLNRR